MPWCWRDTIRYLWVDWRQRHMRAVWWWERLCTAFNRWQWAEADFIVGGASVHAALDGLAVRYGNGQARRRRPLAATSSDYQVLDRSAVAYPPTQNNNAMVGSYTSVGSSPRSWSMRAVDGSTCLPIIRSSSAATCWCRSWCRARSRAVSPPASAWRCTNSCRCTRTVLGTAPGISIAITCRVAATWRYGRRPPKSCRRSRRVSHRKAWLRW